MNILWPKLYILLDRLQEVQTGDYVYAMDVKTGTIEEKRVYDTYAGVKGDIYTIVTDAEVMEATEEHPFWVAGRGWVEAKDLRAGDQLVDDQLQIHEIRTITIDHT